MPRRKNPAAPNVPDITPTARRLGLRAVGDVHADAVGFARACATDRFVLQLGDLTDDGPDPVTTWHLMLARLDSGTGAFLLGNHDWKLLRALRDGQAPPAPTRITQEALAPDLRARVLAALVGAPLWQRLGDAVFVHAAFHAVMLTAPAPLGADIPSHPHGALALALYGQPTGRTRPDGFPERSLAWADTVPAGITVYCGHDRRSRDGRPYVRPSRAGGTVVFLDTGAGKGGHLSWVDLTGGQSSAQRPA